MLELLLSSIMLYILPLIIISSMVLLITISDTILGIIAALKKKEKFNWFRFLDVTAKLLGSALFITIGLGIAILFSWQWGILLGAAYPIITEYKSIERNLIKLNLPTIKDTIEKAYHFALDIKNKKNELTK